MTYFCVALQISFKYLNEKKVLINNDEKVSRKMAGKNQLKDFKF